MRNAFCGLQPFSPGVSPKFSLGVQETAAGRKKAFIATSKGQVC